MPDSLPQPSPHSSQRKRVVAREVTAEVELANREAAALPPEVVIASRVPTPPNDPVTVVDPTTLGRRHRRHSHQKAYRFTQLASVAGAGCSAVSIFCTLGEDVAVARALAGPGVALGLLATVLSGHNHLAARWRGWAIAATVFAATALALTWIVPALSQ